MTITWTRGQGPVRITRDRWIEVGTELYGEDPKKWKFKCPACGHVQSHESVKEHNHDIGDTSNWIFFACEGRHNKGHGCDWTLGGLLRIHRLEVLDDRPEDTMGNEPGNVMVFEFADLPADEIWYETSSGEEAKELIARAEKVKPCPES